MYIYKSYQLMRLSFFVGVYIIFTYRNLFTSKDVDCIMMYSRDIVKSDFLGGKIGRKILYKRRNAIKRRSFNRRSKKLCS